MLESLAHKVIEGGRVTADEAAAAKAEPVTLKSTLGRDDPYGAWFKEEVRRQFREIPGIMERTAKPDYGRADILARQMERVFPGISRADMTKWMGRRPSMPDSLPVIGLSPRHRNAVFAFGHGHIGLSLGARTGALAADLLAGRDPRIDLRPYRIDRF